LFFLFSEHLFKWNLGGVHLSNCFLFLLLLQQLVNSIICSSYLINISFTLNVNLFSQYSILFIPFFTFSKSCFSWAVTFLSSLFLHPPLFQWNWNDACHEDDSSIFWKGGYKSNGLATERLIILNQNSANCFLW